jgi:hypothetical protein
MDYIDMDQIITAVVTPNPALVGDARQTVFDYR